MIGGNNGYAELLMQGAERIYSKHVEIYWYELQWSRIVLLRLRNKLEEAIAVAKMIEDKAIFESNKTEAFRALGCQIQFAQRLGNNGLLSVLFRRFANLPKSHIKEGMRNSPYHFMFISIPLSERLLAAGRISEAKNVLDIALGGTSGELGIGNYLTIKALLIFAETNEHIDKNKAKKMYRRLAAISYEHSLLIQTIDSLSKLAYLEAKTGKFDAAIREAKSHSGAYIGFLLDSLPGLAMEDRVEAIAGFNSDILY
jgi:hypothetical protein